MSSPEPLRKRGRLPGCLLIAVLGALWAIWFFWRDDPVNRAERMLARAGPSAGATRGEVEEWLDSQGIRHKRLGSVDELGGFPATLSPKQFCTLPPGVEGECVVGVIDAPYWFGWASWVWVYFFFDADGRLVQHAVKRWDGYL